MNRFPKRLSLRYFFEIPRGVVHPSQLPFIVRDDIPSIQIYGAGVRAYLRWNAYCTGGPCLKEKMVMNKAMACSRRSIEAQTD
jgi:hypothetical protein